MRSDSRPNILLLLCDQLTARVMRLYGGPVPMPNVERLAAGGAVFDRAYASSVACGPSRACLFTGQYPHTHGIAHNVDRRDYALAPWIDRVPASEEGIRASDTTLGSCLYAAGYDTRYYGKWHLLGDDLPYYPDMYTEKDYLDEMSATFAANRRRHHMDWCGMILPVEQSAAMRDALDQLGDRWDKLVFKPFATRMGRLVGMPAEDLFDAKTVKKTLEFLDNSPVKPFALTCSLIYPHDPYVVPSPYYEMYDPDALELPANYESREARFENDWTREFVKGLGESGLREWLRIYYGAVRFLDDQVGRVLDALDRNGLSENTVVVFTADHGDMAGAHAMAWKNTSALYEDIVRVPLVIRAPGVLAPGRTDILTANVDLMPTLLGLADIAPPPGCEGRNLIPILTGARKPPPFVVCEVLHMHPGRRRSVEPDRPANYMIRDERWKYVRYRDGGEILYDLEKDPGETRNLVDDVALRDELNRLRTALTDWTPLSQVDQQADTISAEIQARLAPLRESPIPTLTALPCLTDFAAHVRLDAWRERWPECEPAECDVRGEIWSDAIEAALQTGDGVHLPARSEPYYLDRPIILRSGQSLIADPDAEIRLTPGTNTCMVRNERAVGFQDGPVPDALTPDTDILVQGGVWTTLATSRGESNGNLRGCADRADSVPGCHGVILLQNVERVVVRDLTIRQSRPFGVHIGTARDFLIENLTFDNHRRDGVHCDGPACFGIIRGIQGVTGDDPVSLLAWDWRHYSASFGPIHHILVEELSGAPLEANSYDSIRLLPGVKQFGDGSTLNCPIRDCVFRDLRDIREFKLYDQPNLELGVKNDFSAAVGELRNLHFEKLYFARPGSFNDGLFHVHANVDGLSLRDVELDFPPPPDHRLVNLGPPSMTWKGGTTDPARWVEVFSPDRDCVIRHLRLSDIRILEGDQRVTVSDTNTLVRVIKQAVNQEYPRTTPRGGTGQATWRRPGNQKEDPQERNYDNHR